MSAGRELQTEGAAIGSDDVHVAENHFVTSMSSLLSGRNVRWPRHLQPQ